MGAEIRVAHGYTHAKAKRLHGAHATTLAAVGFIEAFQGKTKLQQHRMVYATLGDSMQSAIHALSLRTSTPGNK